ncbi:UvrD-helicase domain-containing protein [Luteimicrobium subarcticum]|uniref:RecBCD enzyme subunit RecB n=1 Tax=Luteimicrobium subarcticum TaxID=620910 RepID=A0A2M8WW44_9MICO|nr:UvrD-helicase domain-containing protein [Luteimicrobium subarcticum]PJI95144.1 exodeoxyribonuclease V beta subunit [Luteimicrobium subarcticum]
MTAPAGTTAVFDVCGPLPTGTTVLEASAGTGKTFTIAALVTRYVAEGVARLPQLLVVTFGRNATSELRDRVRERLVTTERALRDPAAASHPDELVRHLAATDATDLAARRSRLTRALAEVDAATITTTHGFCQQMLSALGTATSGGVAEPGTPLLPDVADLEAEVVDDLYLAKYAPSTAATLDVSTARTVARQAVSDHAARLAPEDAEPGTPAADRFGLARAVRRELDRRKRLAHVVDYDDLLVLLRDALAHPESGDAAAARVRERFDVVLVDEFQDTDPVQWEVLERAFHGHRTLVLVGDPKQAIYAFRGADVHTYLRATRVATHATLGTSWRTDEPVLAGLGHLFGGAALGDPAIVVHPVAAAHHERRLEGGPPVVVRRVTRAAAGATGSRAPIVGRVRALVVDDVVTQVVRSLTGSRLRHGDGTRPVEPGDVAVLVRSNKQAVDVQGALTTAGVPAVVSGLSSVFGSPAARDWLALLGALASTGEPGKAGAAALTPFVGWDARRLALADDPEREDLADTLRAWSRVLADRGVAALLDATTSAGLHERLLRRTDGERLLTDVRHVGEVLHATARDEGIGGAALVEWLRARIDDAETDYTDERSRRLETDAAAVQVVTVHAAKGLEYPVVMVPFQWDRWLPRSPEVLHHHDASGERRLHVGGPGSPGYDDALARHRAEELGEDLRLAYVALTRASSQVFVWWAPSTVTGAGAVGRLVLGERDVDGRPAPNAPVPSDDVAGDRFDAFAATSGGTVAHEPVSAWPVPATWVRPPGAHAELAVARFGRTVDTTWRRTSYSGLTAHAHDAGPAGPASPLRAGVADEPETPGVQDEPDGPLDAVAAGSVVASSPDHDQDHDHDHDHDHDGLRSVPSPLDDLPGGTAFGTLVHAVLEHTDTHSDDLEAEVRARCEATGLAPALGIQPARLASALLPSLHTPCGPLLGGRTLAQLPAADRLAELEFELPLAGGDRHDAARRDPTLRAIADLLRVHLAPDDPFASYADQLTELGDDAFRGYLTGSIDAVLRVPGPAGHRYVVVDYKTNRLAPPGEPLTAWHYRPDALVRAMGDSHYPLQLLLYTVALHRYLRWRLAGYDPDGHLGGGAYLFVRGMCGPDTPVVPAPGRAHGSPDPWPCGVLSWRPPTSLVVALSALLDGAPPEGTVPR